MKDEDEDDEYDDDDTQMSNDADDDASDTFLQPLRGRDRRQMLKSAGVRVDRSERNECQTIRQSRQTCGCTCVDECRPDSCECIRDAIKCQV